MSEVTTIYDLHLDQVPANYEPLSPLTFGKLQKYLLRQQANPEVRS